MYSKDTSQSAVTYWLLLKTKWLRCAVFIWHSVR